MKKFISAIKKTFKSMNATRKQMEQYLDNNPVPTI